jgi:hypothetical protein
MDSDARLIAAMAALVAETGTMEAPPEVEAAVLAEFDAARRGTIHRWLPIAACIAAAAMLLRGPAPPPRIARERPFVQIPYVAPLAPYERVSVRRIEMPVTALIAAGFEMPAREMGAAVPADVLVGQDGRALALRLVQERRN